VRPLSRMGEYRDRIYIRKDIILKLVQYRTLNQTALLSYCGLNLQKHKPILDDMESKGLITKKESFHGRKKITSYSVTIKGIEFCKRILEPYEAMFPRIRKDV
jgi:predicted transcriptional regulator